MVTLPLHVMAISPWAVTVPATGSWRPAGTTPTAVNVRAPFAAVVKLHVPVSAGWPTARLAEYCNTPESVGRSKGVRTVTFVVDSLKLVVLTVTVVFVGARFCSSKGVSG